MTTKKALSAKNLEQLGVERLTGLLLEICAGNAIAKRRVLLELASLKSPAEAAKEIRKRFSAIKRSTSFIDWQKRKLLVDDLLAQKRAIVETIALTDPKEATELMWEFLDLAESIFGRSDDGTGTISGIFHDAVIELGKLAAAAKPAPKQLADKILYALNQNGYGQYDHLISGMKDALQKQGIEHLKNQLKVLERKSLEKPSDEGRTKIGRSPSAGPICREDFERQMQGRRIKLALQEIADIENDPDAYIAQHSKEERQIPAIAAHIATRLLTSGRAKEALKAIEAVQDDRAAWPVYEFEDARIAVFEALERSKDAQNARWTCFERFFSIPHLREFLKHLPEFEDIEAEERAILYVETHKDLLRSLWFLIEWPSLNTAARLVLARAKELDGNRYEILTSAAEKLAGNYPLAATLILRAMIDFSLNTARSSRYKHAARHLVECGSLAPAIDDYCGFTPHDDYVEKLRHEHGRKFSFWSEVD